MQNAIPITQPEQPDSIIGDKEFKFEKLWYVTDVNQKLLRWEVAKDFPPSPENKVINTFTHFVELHQKDLFINGVRVGPRKCFLNIHLVNGEVEIHYGKDYSFLDTPDHQRDFLNTWTDGSNKVFPIKVGDRVVGTAIGDIENGDYEFSIHDRDFLLKLNQEPAQSRPNDNDRSLRWCRGKNRKEKLSPLSPLFYIFPFNLSDEAKKVLIDNTRNKDDVRNWGSDIYSGEK